MGLWRRELIRALHQLEAGAGLSLKGPAHTRLCPGSAAPSTRNLYLFCLHWHCGVDDELVVWLAAGWLRAEGRPALGQVSQSVSSGVVGGARKAASALVTPGEVLCSEPSA